jgi:hypothetical protein
MDRRENDLIQNLKDAGCRKSDCEIFLGLSEEEQKEMLEKKRSVILKAIHTAKEELECLDFLRYQYVIKGEKNGNNNEEI